MLFCTLPVTAQAADGTWDALTTQEKKSSYGYFVWKSENAATQDEKDAAAKAANVLKGEYASDLTSWGNAANKDALLGYTKLGEDGDATTLANMQQAIVDIQQINDFRSSLSGEPCRVDMKPTFDVCGSDTNKTLTPYGITDVMMAMAQLNANWMAGQTNIATAHAGVFNVAENGAWNRTTTGSAAANQWYSEKAKFDKGIYDSQVGHYANLTNKSWGGSSADSVKLDEYTLSGLGVVTRITAGTVAEQFQSPTITQDYGQVSVWGPQLGPEMSVADYLADFNAYVDMVNELGKQYSVTFNSNGGSAVAVQTIDSGKSVTKPTDPTRAGYKFVGWYSDQNLTAEYDFNTPVRANATLYAKWEKVTIKSVAAPAAQTVESGSEPTYPETVTATYSDGTTGQVAVQWSKLSEEQYGKRAGGTFTVKGTIDGFDKGVSFEVTVSPATVKDVRQPAKATVSKGVKPTIPTTAQVTWSNGDTSDEEITWKSGNDPSDTKFDEVKDYEFTGTVEGKKIAWTVTVVEAKVTDVTNPEDVTVNAGDTLDTLNSKLPKTVKAELDNGEKNQEVPVEWNELTDADKTTLSGRKGGTITLTGVVNGQTDKIATVKINVTPATINDTTLPSISTPAGKAPALPETVSVTWSNGEVQNDVKVVWDKIDTDKYGKTGSFDAEGSVSEDGVTGKVTQPVTVTDPVAVKAEATQKTVEVIATHAPNLSGINATVTYTDGSKTTNQVRWDAVDAEQYANEGSFDTNGTVLKDTASSAAKADSDELLDENGNVLTVKVTVNVKARAITAVTPSADELTVATAKDGDPQPTVTGKVTVKWNDGATETREVPLSLPQGWNHPRTEHSVQVNGKVDGWNKDVPFTVNVQAATAESAANPAAITTTVKVVPTLPQTATVTWSNGDTSEETVEWTKPDDAAYDNEGQVTVNGIVEGKAVQVTVNVTAATLTGVDSPAGPFETEAGKAPANLPSTVTAHWSNNTESQIAVTWNTEDVDLANRSGKDKTVEVKGTVDGWEKPVTVTVTVKSATATGAQIDGNTVVTTESGTAPKLPENAKVQWNDGGADSTEAIEWDKFDGYKDRKGGTFTVNGTVYGQTVTATVTVTPATPTKLQSDQVKVSTTVGVKPAVPEKAEVVWSNGDVTEEPIVWDTYDAASLAKEGTFTVKGKVTVPADASGNATETKTFDTTVTVTVKKVAEKPGQNQNGQTQNGQHKSDSKSQKRMSNTGASVAVIMMAVVVLAVIAGAILTVAKRQQQR